MELTTIAERAGTELTGTVTSADVVCWFPARSVALAVRWCTPDGNCAVVKVHEDQSPTVCWKAGMKGAVVASVWTSTDLMPAAGSLEVPVRVIRPSWTELPVIETAGGCVSIVIVIGLEKGDVPEASVPLAEKVCRPSCRAAGVTDQEPAEEAMTAAPRGA